MKAEGRTESFGLQAEQNPKPFPPPQNAFVFRQFSLLYFMQPKKTLIWSVPKMFRSVPGSLFFFFCLQSGGEIFLKKFNQFLENLRSA